MKRDNIHLLKEYLIKADTWVGADDLASFLHVTERTIRNYVCEINADDSFAEPPIISGPRGYQWHVADKSGQKIYETRRPFVYPPENRKYYLIRQLIHDIHISVDELLNILVVSERTLEQDIQGIRNLLRSFDIELHLKRNIYRLHGHEIDIRRLCMDCILKSCKVELVTVRFIETAFGHIDVSSLVRLLDKTLEGSCLCVSGYERANLLLLVTVQFDRIILQRNIGEEELPFPEAVEYPDHAVAQTLSAAIEREFGFHYNVWKIKYLTLLLLAKCDYIVAERKPITWLKYFDRFYEIALKCLEIGERYLAIDFHLDGFDYVLTHFFLRMDVRQKMHMNVANPLTTRLRDVHPLMMDIAAQMLMKFSAAFEIQQPDDEVGTLALLLSDYIYERFNFERRLKCTLVCPQFSSLSGKIALQLEERLGNIIEIEDIITTTDIEQLSEKTDLVISLLPVRSSSHTVMITPMANSGDFRHIMEEAHIIKEQRRRRYLSTYIQAYLRPNLFEIDHNYKSMEEAISDACHTLVSEGCVEEGFEQAVLERERMDPTLFKNMVALPHACCSLVKKNALRIVLNHTPIPWGNKGLAYMMVLIALEEELLPDFQEAYGLFVTRFSNPSAIMSLLKVKSYEDFMALIKEEIQTDLISV